MKGKTKLRLTLALLGCVFLAGLCLATHQDAQQTQPSRPVRPSSPEIAKVRATIVTLQSDLFLVSEQLKFYTRLDVKLRQDHVEANRKLNALENAWRTLRQAAQAQDKKTTETSKGVKSNEL